MAAIKASGKVPNPPGGTAGGDAKPDKKLVPASPEAVRSGPKKRKRLAKAFKRPLDKELKNESVVREKIALSKEGYEQVLELKHRLMIQGLSVKKSELVRAGLVLLDALDAADLTVVIDKIRCTEA